MISKQPNQMNILCLEYCSLIQYFITFDKVLHSPFPLFFEWNLWSFSYFIRNLCCKLGNELWRFLSNLGSHLFANLCRLFHGWHCGSRHIECRWLWAWWRREGLDAALPSIPGYINKQVQRVLRNIEQCKMCRSWYTSWCQKTLHMYQWR